MSKSSRGEARSRFAPRSRGHRGGVSVCGPVRQKRPGSAAGRTGRESGGERAEALPRCASRTADESRRSGFAGDQKRRERAKQRTKSRAPFRIRGDTREHKFQRMSTRRDRAFETRSRGGRQGCERDYAAGSVEQSIA